MSITFAGQPLLMEDPAGKFSAWLDWAMDYENFNPFAGPVYKREGRDNPRGEDPGTAFVGLPIPNYPDPPKLRLNSLYVPTGAGRWSQGLFLVDNDALLEIDKVIDDSTTNGSAVLSISEGKTTLDLQMFAFGPRRVSEPGDKAVYVLPVVDQRWFWQWQDVGELVVDDETTWSELLTQLSAKYDPPIADLESLLFSIPLAYMQPDPVELTRRYENYAMLLDAIAACLGKRVLFDPATSRLELQGYTEAGDRLSDGVTDNAARAILNFSGEGQASRHIIPTEVRVCFPKTIQDIQTATGELFTITKSAAEFITGNPQTGFTTQVFFDTAHAEFAGGSYPANLPQLDALTTEIASDFYGWLTNHYDIAYSGVISWTPNGFDDYVLYEINTRNENKIDGIAEGDYVAMTRVRSLPYNFGLREQLHQMGFLFESSSSTSSTSQASESSSSTLVSTSSSSSSSESSLTESQSSSSSSTLVSTSSSSSSSPSVSESSSSGDKVVRLVQDVCCDDSIAGGGVDVCYTTLHLKFVPAHRGYVIAWVNEEACVCN